MIAESFFEKKEDFSLENFSQVILMSLQLGKPDLMGFFKRIYSEGAV